VAQETVKVFIGMETILLLICQDCGGPT